MTTCRQFKVEDQRCHVVSGIKPRLPDCESGILTALPYCTKDRAKCKTTVTDTVIKRPRYQNRHCNPNANWEQWRTMSITILRDYSHDLNWFRSPVQFAIADIDIVWSETTVGKYCCETGIESHACTSIPIRGWRSWTLCPEEIRWTKKTIRKVKCELCTVADCGLTGITG